MSQLVLLDTLSTPPAPLPQEQFAPKLLAWYQIHQRPLPWRATQDPYTIWLSEIILQQTRVVQGLPYYHRFKQAYPTVQALAAAEEEAVLRLWQGLGYYTRARNLHACARKVVRDGQGKFPTCYTALLDLPGIGRYTAAAIASFAFNEPVAVVDGNVYRVLARVFGLFADIGSVQGKKVFFDLAQSLIPVQAAGRYNQAIMDFGALQCRPVNPLCTTCTFKAYCVARYMGKQAVLPVKQQKLKIKNRFLHYFVIQARDVLYMKRRGVADIWPGLYDFYLVEDIALKTVDTLSDTLLALIRQYQLPVTRYPRLYTHLLSHQRLQVYFFHVQATPAFLQAAQEAIDQAALRSFTMEEVSALPKSILVHQFLAQGLGKP